MNILITGGTGFIGQALVKALRDNHHTVVVFCRDIEKAKRILGSSVEYVYYFRDINTPIDAVINLAGVPSIVYGVFGFLALYVKNGSLRP